MNVNGDDREEAKEDPREVRDDHGPVFIGLIPPVAHPQRCVDRSDEWL